MLLARFLDSDIVSTPPDPDFLRNPTPLVFRMLEAVGEPIPTNPLPLAFAHADLGENRGWKSQIDAAEQLARAVSVPVIASGGVSSLTDLIALKDTGVVSGAISGRALYDGAIDLRQALAALAG